MFERVDQICPEKVGIISIKAWHFLTRVDPSGDDVHGQWKYYGGVLLHADFRHCLEVAKLDSCGLPFEDGCHFGELRRGLELSFGVDDFCATLAFGFRLPRDSSLHGLRNVHLLDFHFRYLDALSARHITKSPELLGPDQIRSYQVDLTNERKLATKSTPLAISVLRFLYKVTLKKSCLISSIDRIRTTAVWFRAKIKVEPNNSR